ncbi:MAG: desulfoferrodoxin [Clostridia bacterium]|nr:desulfoferrodoxin [Clostridia bacterium]
MKNVKFYICEHCGNIVYMVEDSGVNPVCCGKKMTKLEAGVVEASREKHIPVVTLNGNEVTVSVGSVTHPMTEEHNIAWVYLATDKGGAIKYLNANEEPTVKFTVTDEKPLAAYAYCNLHGLWKAEI